MPFEPYAQLSDAIEAIASLVIPVYRVLGNPHQPTTVNIGPDTRRPLSTNFVYDGITNSIFRSLKQILEGFLTGGLDSRIIAGDIAPLFAFANTVAKRSEYEGEVGVTAAVFGLLFESVNHIIRTNIDIDRPGMYDYLQTRFWRQVGGTGGNLSPGQTDVRFWLGRFVGILCEIKPTLIFPDHLLNRLQDLLRHCTIDQNGHLTGADAEMEPEVRKVITQVWTQFMAEPSARFLVLYNLSSVMVFERTGNGTMQYTNAVNNANRPSIDNPHGSIFATMLGLSVLPNASFYGDWAGAITPTDQGLATVPISPPQNRSGARSASAGAVSGTRIVRHHRRQGMMGQEAGQDCADDQEDPSEESDTSNGDISFSDDDILITPHSLASSKPIMAFDLDTAHLHPTPTHGLQLPRSHAMNVPSSTRIRLCRTAPPQAEFASVTEDGHGKTIGVTTVVTQATPEDEDADLPHEYMLETSQLDRSSSEIGEQRPTLQLHRQLGSGAVWDGYLATLSTDARDDATLAADDAMQVSTHTQKIATVVAKLSSTDLAYGMTAAHARDLIRRETRVYQLCLSSLQGTVVPGFHGLFAVKDSSTGLDGQQEGPGDDDTPLRIMLLDYAGKPRQSLDDAAKRNVRSHYKSLHAAGVLHGDVGAQHWLFRGDEVWITDFGCAVIRSDVASDEAWSKACQHEDDVVAATLASV